MSRLQKMIALTPECYFLLFSLSAIFPPSGHINFFALLVAVIFAIQFLYKNKNVGILIGWLLLLMNFYVVLSVAGRGNDTPDFSHGICFLCRWGWQFLLLHGLMAIGLIYKNIRVVK